MFSSHSELSIQDSQPQTSQLPIHHLPTPHTPTTINNHNLIIPNSLILTQPIHPQKPPITPRELIPHKIPRAQWYIKPLAPPPLIITLPLRQWRRAACKKNNNIGVRLFRTRTLLPCSHATNNKL